MAQQIYQSLPLNQGFVSAIEKSISFLLAAAASLALTINVAFYESFPFIRLGATLLAFLLLHLHFHPRILFSREFALYAWFFAYMIVQLLWTVDDLLAMNTLVPVITFIVILVLFGSLVTFHNIQAVLTGIFVGVLAGAITYTVATGFPFVYPTGFSYNAMAVLYLFGLFVTLLLGSLQRSKIILLPVGLVFLSLILATTSLKANFGIFLGATSAALVYFRSVKMTLGRNLIALVILTGLLGVAVVSNDNLMERLEGAASRLALGVELIQAQEDVTGYLGRENRVSWAREGLSGWVRNPVFGYGVEAFRSQVGITSHSTPIDLLYNSGLIGFVLFYSIFASILWRLFLVRNARPAIVYALIFGTLVCFLFITLLGTMHYSSFLAAFIGISVGLLIRYQGQNSPAEFAGT
jgi:hypothetical protein